MAAGPALAVPSLPGTRHFPTLDFGVAVGNRTANTVSISRRTVERSAMSVRISPAPSPSEETPIGQNDDQFPRAQSAPGPVAQVTFSAQNMTTGALSAGVAATLVKDITTYVDVAPCAATDAGSAAPCLSVGSVSGAQAGRPVRWGRDAPFSALSGSGQSFTATGWNRGREREHVERLRVERDQQRQLAHGGQRRLRNRHRRCRVPGRSEYHRAGAKRDPVDRGPDVHGQSGGLSE